MNERFGTILPIFITILLGACVVQSQADDVDQNANFADDGQIVVDRPKVDTIVTSPVILSGEARGSLFLEAVLAVDVVDEEGNVVGKGAIRAEGDWMTDDFVPFQGKIAFDLPDGVSNSAGAIAFIQEDISGGGADKVLFSVPVMLNK